MTAIHDRLARIARQELRENYASIDDQADAMAAAIITELELTKEWADADADGELDEWACGHQIICSSRQPRVHRDYDTPVWRLVSAWIPAEGMLSS